MSCQVSIGYSLLNSRRVSRADQYRLAWPVNFMAVKTFSASDNRYRVKYLSMFCSQFKKNLQTRTIKIIQTTIKGQYIQLDALQVSVNMILFITPLVLLERPHCPSRSWRCSRQFSVLCKDSKACFDLGNMLSILFIVASYFARRLGSILSFYLIQKKEKKTNFPKQMPKFF